MNAKRKQQLELRKRQRQRLKNAKSKSNDFETACQLHQSGNLPGARDAYCKALEKNPAHHQAWHMLGMLLYQTGELDAALGCLNRVREALQQDSSFWDHLGVVHRAAGQLDEARTCLEQASQLAANSKVIQNNLGTVLLEQQQFEQAESLFRSALRQDPSYLQAKSNLGSALQRQKRFHEAKDCLLEVVRETPDDVAALNNLGAVYQSLRQKEEALKIYECAAKLAPESEELQVNLGRAYINLGRLDDGESCFRRLLQSKPNSAHAYHQLGMVLAIGGKHEEAMGCFHNALRIDPKHAFAESALGFSYLDTGHFEIAAKHFKRALNWRPDLHHTHSNLLFVMSSDPNIASQKLFEEHCKWGSMHGNVEPVFQHLPHERTHPNRTSQKLRIGYVSPDFRNHVVARYFEPVLKSHDKSRFEIFCYGEIFKEDAFTQQIKNLADHWRSTVGYSHFQVAEQVVEDQIDILVDLAGHTAHNRLPVFAYKPAPVQVTWLGYPNTTGLDTVDYRISSEIQNPSCEESFHTEELLRLDVGPDCYEPAEKSLEVSPLPARTNGFVTFGSLHRPQKMSEGVFDLWCSVLNSCPHSRLLVYHSMLKHESEKHVRSQLLLRGIPEDRFTLQNKSTDTYLKVYNRIDIGLDVFPWNGGTTTREALWMGVPVIGLYGNRRSARATAATLDQVGLDELIAPTPEKYIQCACALANDWHRLEQLRQTMRDRMSRTICDAKRFTTSLEAAYHQIWKRWLDGYQPTPLLDMDREIGKQNTYANI